MTPAFLFQGGGPPKLRKIRRILRSRAYPTFAFLVKALARHAVVAWEGVGDAAGKPLPLSPEAVERLMDLDDIAAAFWDRATAPVAAVAAEGNG